jgi:hypothetical protein
MDEEDDGKFAGEAAAEEQERRSKEERLEDERRAKALSYSAFARTSFRRPTRTRKVALRGTRAGEL